MTEKTLTEELEKLELEKLVTGGKPKPAWQFSVQANFLGIEGISRHCTKSWIVSTLIKEAHNIDANPPYQRDTVWGKRLKQDYIKAMFEGMAASPLHIVQKSVESSHHYWLLDGKQRFTAIIQFIQNKFPVKLICNDGKYRNAYWRDICQNCPALQKKFENAELKIEIWEPMSMETQRLVFEKINQNVALTQDEILYGKNYLFKGFLKTLVHGPFAKIAPFTPPKIRNDKNRYGCRQIHIIAYICGALTNGEFAPRAYPQKKRTATANEMEERFKTKFGLSFKDLDHNYAWTPEIMKKTGLDKFAKQLTDACGWFHDAIRYNNAQPIKTRFDAGLLIDFLCFLIKLQQDKILTTPYVRANLALMHQFIVAWIQTKKQDDDKKELSTKTQDRGQVEKRFRRIEEVAIRVGLDLSPKNKRLPKDEVLLASLDTGFRDPIDGRAIHEENAQFDHVQAKSQASETSIRVISRASNGQVKGSVTLEEARALVEYCEGKDSENCS